MNRIFSMYRLSLTIIVLFLCMLPALAQAAFLLDRIVAVVNREVITWSELFKLMESESTEEIKTLPENERRKIFKESEPLFLERLIDMRLQIQEAQKLGLEAAPEEVNEAIENIKKKYSMDQETLIQSLKKEGLTLGEYKKKLAEQILIGQVINQQVRSKIVVSDEEIREFVDKNKELFSGGETYKLRQIFFRRPTSEEAKRSLEEKAFALSQRLREEGDFAILAREFSEDPSAKRDGDLGYVKKEYMAKEFLDALSTMHVGEFSKPFWTEWGLHIIKLEDKISALNIEEVKETVRKKLVEEKFLEKYKSWIKSLREKSYIEIYL